MKIASQIYYGPLKKRHKNHRIRIYYANKYLNIQAEHHLAWDEDPGSNLLMTLKQEHDKFKANLDQRVSSKTESAIH